MAVKKISEFDPIVTLDGTELLAGAKAGASNIRPTVAQILGSVTTAVGRIIYKGGEASDNTAPIKLTSATLNTNASAGSIEFLADAYYGTITSANARKTFAFLESPTFTGTVGGITAAMVGAAPTNHNLLSSTHGDTTAGACVRGDIITGQGISPTWSKLAIGTVGKALVSDGTDVAWSATALGTAAFTASTAYEVPLTFGSGLTRSVNAVANDLITGKAGGQTVIGGTGVTDILTIQGTNANGTLSSPAIQYKVGNNGAIIAGTILNNGNRGFGLVAPIGIVQVSQPTAGVGTVTITGTTTCTGTNTQFLNTFKVGDSIIITATSETKVISAIASNTVMTIAAGTNTVDSAYTLTGGSRFIVLGNGRMGLNGITVPTSMLHLPAGSATAQTAPLQFTSGTLETTPRAGVVEFLTDQWYGVITTGTARKGFVMNDGTALTSGRLVVSTTNGRVVDAPDLSGTGNRMVQAAAAGTISASATIVTGKLSDSAVIALLVNDANWTLAVYTGSAITGTYEGMYYSTGNYFYQAYSDNVWLRSLIVLDLISFNDEPVFLDDQMITM